MKIFIHFGPPKCGTSSIQKWCLENRGFLKQNSIYYPPHDIDRNGISSGNFFSVYDKSTSTFSHTKYLQLTKNAHSANCKLILLSSEFFFEELSTLNETLKDVHFIGYIRFGYDLFLSSYNQSIKRHGNTGLLSDFKDVYILEKLSKAIRQIGRSNFTLNFLSKRFLLQESLIKDFMSNFSLDVDHLAYSNLVVNNSYSLEALEVKRWINQVSHLMDTSHFDIALQKYDGNFDYIFLCEKQYRLKKSIYLHRLRRFLSQVSFVKSWEFYNHCCNHKKKDSFPQKVSDEEFLDVFRYMISRKKISYYDLLQLVEVMQMSKITLDHPHRLCLVFEIVSRWRRFLWRICKKKV